MGEFSNNEIVGTSSQSSDSEIGHMNNGGSDRPERFLEYPELEIIEFEGILNFRSALPGTGLPIYRCAALDNSTASDTERLLTPGWLKSDDGSAASTRCTIAISIRIPKSFFCNVFHLLLSHTTTFDNSVSVVFH